MKLKKYMCEVCHVQWHDTHIHHIIPVANGGTDDDKNLIELCPPCHQKAHGANFNGDSGLIKKGISERKDKYKNSLEFLEINNYILINFCEDFSNEYDTEVLHEMMRFGVLSLIDFMDIIKGNCNKNFGEVKNMIKSLYDKNKEKYQFIY